MTRWKVFVVALALTGGLARGGDALAADPAPVRIPASRLAVVPLADGDPTQWSVGAGVDYRVVGKELLIVAPPGTHVVVGAVASGAGIVFKRIVVTAEGGVPGPNPTPPNPTPPNPNPVPPGPNPNPPNPNPVPPGPNPVPPVPPDRLTADLQAAYGISAGTPEVKFATLKLLTELYTQFAKLINETDASKKQTVPQLLAILKAAGVSLKTDDLRPIRAVVASELGKVLPTDTDAIITSENRTAAVGILTAIVARLENIK